MIEVEKQVKVIIDGRDAQMLSNVCELARRMCCHGGTQVEYGEKHLYEIKQFINYIFDNT